MKRVIVDTDALKNNYDVIRKKVRDDTVIYLVVKGNAYGLDTKLYVSEMVSLGARHFATADIDDAVYIKNFCHNAEVLLMTPINSESIAQTVVKHGIVASVENEEGARLIGNFAKEPHPVHIKIDVGFGRYGVRADDIHELENICKTQGIQIDGVFTHLPKSADKHKKETLKMLDGFFECVSYIKELGADPKRIHMLGSVGVFRFFDERSTAVRVGSAMTGRMPGIAHSTSLKNVATLECSVNSIKNIKKGEFVGYSGLYKAKKDIVSAVLDVGFSDGFSVLKIPNGNRTLDICRRIKHELTDFLKRPKITASIKGKTVNAIGSIGMTAASFDITGIDVDLSDTAVIDINPIYIDSAVQRIYK